MGEVKSKEILLKEIKTFKELEKEIVNTKKCTACGACVAYCNSQGFNIIKMEDYTPKYISETSVDNCKECGVCYYICPSTTPLLDQLNETYQIEDEIGHIITILVAKTTNEKISKVYQDGGIVSTILTYLFEKNKIDAAIVSEFDEKFEPVPKIIYDKDDLLKSAGTRYSISSNILPLKDLYNISQEVREKKNIIEIDDLRIAFVGTPCQCRAIRKMQYLSISPAYVIKLIIGLFCFETFDYKKLYDILKKETNVNPTEIKKTWIKKNFFLESKKDTQFEINIKTLNPAIRTHCFECDEFTARFSDLSVGAAGAPKGNSIVIVRTDIGQEIINSIISENFVEKYIIPAEEMLEWKTKKINWFRKLISLKMKR